MPLRPLYGHDSVRGRLLGALAAGRLPQALLIEGPRGVGKQRLALWLAQAELCDRGPLGQEPCGVCQACRLVLGLSHPDLHWFVPVEINRKGADADKQVELVSEALGEEMAARRERPLYQPPSGLASHGIASVRLLGRAMVVTPALARRKVFVLGDADRLVPQQSSPEAANALLKALEEPPADTRFVLTSAEPDSMLATTLSRVVRIRLARLPSATVREFAERELGEANKNRNEALVQQADGSIGRLIALAGEPDGNNEALRSFVEAGRRSAPDRYARALAQHPFQARGGFSELLDGLLTELRSEARSGKDTGRVVAAIARVLEARQMAQGNVNPQLLAAVLADDLWSAT